MNEIYKSINEKSGGKYNSLRFPSVTFGKTAEVTVVCKKSDRELVNLNLHELTALLSEICCFHTPITIKVKDEPVTAAALRVAVVKFTEKFNYVSSMSHTISAESENGLCVKLKMHNAMYDLAKNDYIVRLKEFLCNNYAEEVKLDVDIVEYANSGTASATAHGGAKKEYVITNAQPYIGDFKPDKARFVASITASEYNVAVCGILVMQTEFTSKNGRSYERFLIYDGDLSLQCRYFPNGGKSIAGASELMNKPVCVFGNVEYDGMRNEASMTVKEISLCTAEDLLPLPERAEPTGYGLIFPENFEVLVQSSMFDGNIDIPPILRGDFVVFDFETTGLSVIYDKPTELGAVKISNGTLKESFTTLIDPRREIPPEVVEKTGITNEMVKGQPLFEDILLDFYKFTYGCSLVCHNIAFDFPFLLRGGNRSGWAFGNRKTYDTMAIAPLAIPGITKLTLDKVLEGLGLSNDNAHRALSDAAATAKAFIAMQKILAKKS